MNSTESIKINLLICKAGLQILTILFTSLLSFSQSDSTKSKTIFSLKTDILIPAIYLLNNGQLASLTFEYGFNNSFSFQLTGMYSKSSTPTYEKISERYIIEDFKFFTQNNKPSFSGLYIGAYSDQIFEYAFGHPTANEYIEYKRNILGIGPILGYQNYFRNRLVFDIIFGIGNSFEIYRKIMREENVNLALIHIPIDIRLAFNIGYRF